MTSKTLDERPAVERKDVLCATMTGTASADGLAPTISASSTAETKTGTAEASGPSSIRVDVKVTTGALPRGRPSGRAREAEVAAYALKYTVDAAKRKFGLERAVVRQYVRRARKRGQ